jgi:hypothetical protein
VPPHLVIQGPCSAAKLAAIVKQGYRKWLKLQRNGWSPGGPAPTALDYEDIPGPLDKIPAGTDIYFWKPNDDSEKPETPKDRRKQVKA